MGTTWNTPKQTTGTIQAVNAELRSVGLTSNGGSIRPVDITGEPKDKVGRIRGLSEWAGVSVRTVQYWFSRAGTATRPAVRLNDSIILDSDGRTTAPGMVGRRVYDLHTQSQGYFPALQPLRRRMFLAALVGGELRREPVYSLAPDGSGDRTAQVIQFTSIVGALNEAFKVWSGEQSRWIQFGWTSMWIEPSSVYEDGIAKQTWDFHMEYRLKRPADNYMEQETDTEGNTTGQSMDEVEEYEDDY